MLSYIDKTTHQITFIVFILFIPLVAGYLIRRRRLLQEPDIISTRTIVWLTKLITPVIVLLSFWKLELTSLKIFTLPVAGLLISATALIPALFFSRLHKLSRRQKGSYLGSAMFSNIGYTLGGFIAFVLYGEVGFGLTVLFCLYFKPYYYTVGFYMAENYGSEKKIKIGQNLKRIFTEGIRLLPLLGLMAGIGLNLLSVPRPQAAGHINDFLIPVSTFIYMLAIGLTMKFSAIKRFKSPLLSISLIKFVFSPAVGILLAYLFGYHTVMDGLPLKITLIEAFMPSAIASLILPSLFNLDQDLANSLWLFTTFMIIPLLPVILLLLQLL